jgi:uncharacterized protein YndB with AHSA1/START domain
MKPAIIIIGSVVALVALMAAIGALLPKEHVATQSARFKSPPAAVWEVMTDITKFVRWRKDLKALVAHAEGDPRAGWTELWTHGERVPIVVEEWNPPARLVTRIAAKDLAFGGTWTYVLTPAGDGTELRITEDGEVYNPLFRFLSRFVFGHTATMRDYLLALGERLGERVEVRD